MPPLALDPHSCGHCQQLKIEETTKRKRQGSDSNSEKEDTYKQLNFSCRKIVAGATDGCSFCKWLLDTEWIHRSVTVDETYRHATHVKPGFQSFIDAMAESSIRMDFYLPPPNPANTLRKYYTENRKENMDDLTLVCTFEKHMDIRLFGLWDLKKRHLVYRTRYGFSVFTSPGDPVAGVISTRPIEKEVGSDVILAKVSGWLHECLQGEIRGKKLHKDCPTPRNDYLPTRLIEITKVGDGFKLKLKATSGTPTEPYCALSYCWGGEQHIKSTKASLSTWMESIPWDDLPQTLRDAVTVCQKLSIKYLWVDAFCIVQDDQEDKTIEITQMLNVYYNSTLTIAASRASNVREGFLEEQSERQFIPEVFTLKYHANRTKIHGSITLIRAQITPEPLDTRGWTLQERLLSARTLEFGSRQLRFICQHNPRGSTDGWRLKPEHNEFRQDNFENTEVFQACYIQSRNPQVNVYYDVMETWYRLVYVYSHRNLTLPEDRILAISVIAERYGRFLNDSYIAGLWRSTLSRSLYWIAIDNTRPRPDVWQGPSWSWLSLSGPVTFPPASSLDTVEPHVVAVDIDLQNSANPYGAIIESSGRLVVKARRLATMLIFSPEQFGGTSTWATSLRMNETGGLFKIMISVDSLDEARKAADDGGTDLLELSSLCTDQKWSTRGLVVWRYGEDSFTRLGTFEYRTGNSNSRKPSESVEDWRLRASREFNWFGKVGAGIYDIL